MRLRFVLLSMLGLLAVGGALSLPLRSHAAQPPAELPAWLEAHVGTDDGQIARPVLERARALYLRKSAQGIVRNPCYFAMDATRPADLGGGTLGRRFYVVCEASRSFSAISSGHGSGRDLKGVLDFSNGRECAKNFGNALDSNLTAGGAYVTSEIKTSFKGYYRGAARQDAALLRSFVQFDGEGETANARQRAIGGHAAELVGGMCRRKGRASPYADRDGYVPFGRLVDYSAGRSNGCTSWAPADAAQIVRMVKDNPTTLYIYPESGDIAAVARAAAKGRPLAQAGLYWNASCLKKIGAPKFWPAKSLEPVIAKYRKDHPAPPPRPLPICAEP